MQLLPKIEISLNVKNDLISQTQQKIHQSHFWHLNIFYIFSSSCLLGCRLALPKALNKGEHRRIIQLYTINKNLTFISRFVTTAGNLVIICQTVQKLSEMWNKEQGFVLNVDQQNMPLVHVELKLNQVQRTLKDRIPSTILI